jgi:hypothetical protein
MAWDLGIEGLLVLAALSIGVGLLAQLVSGPHAPTWLWVRVSAVYFVVGAWITDAWFGWATTDQLTLEDMFLVGLAPIPAVVLVTRAVYRGHGRRWRRADQPPRAHRHPTPHSP